MSFLLDTDTCSAHLKPPVWSHAPVRAALRPSVHFHDRSWRTLHMGLPPCEPGTDNPGHRGRLAPRRDRTRFRRGLRQRPANPGAISRNPGRCVFAWSFSPKARRAERGHSLLRRPTNEMIAPLRIRIEQICNDPIQAQGTPTLRLVGRRSMNEHEYILPQRSQRPQRSRREISREPRPMFIRI